MQIVVMGSGVGRLLFRRHAGSCGQDVPLIARHPHQGHPSRWLLLGTQSFREHSYSLWAAANAAILGCRHPLASIRQPDWHPIDKTVVNFASLLMSVTAQDPARGKFTEIDHLHGHVVRLGQALSVLTQVNRSLQMLVKLLERRGHAVDTVHSDETLSKSAPNFAEHIDAKLGQV